MGSLVVGGDSSVKTLCDEMSIPAIVTVEPSGRVSVRLALARSLH